MAVHNDSDTVEISIREYQDFLNIGAKLEAQQTLALEQDKEQRKAIKALTENITSMTATVREVLDALHIVVNVPQQPAPTVNVEAVPPLRRTIVHYNSNGQIASLEEVAIE